MMRILKECKQWFVDAFDKRAIGILTDAAIAGMFCRATFDDSSVGERVVAGIAALLFASAALVHARRWLLEGIDFDDGDEDADAEAVPRGME